MAVPLALDLGIWLGPKLSISRLSKQMLAVLPDMSVLGSQYQQSAQMVQQWFTALGESTNVLTLLSVRAWGLPGMTDSFASAGRQAGATQRVLEIQSWSALAGLVALFGLVSLLLSCLYLALVAQGARDEPPHVVHVLGVTWRCWLRLVALACVVVLAFGAVSVAVIMAASVLTVVSPQLGGIVLSLFTLVTLWFGVYASFILFFGVRALVLDDVGILRAIWSGFNVAHRNMLSALVFVVLINLIQTGLMYIWRLLGGRDLGVLAGMLGNAFVSTGLVMASFVYYRDRFVVWQDAVAQAKAGEGQP
jgi:hypothetical protein